MVFPYYDSSTGKDLSFVKYRSTVDKHHMSTSKNSRPCLFGWQAFPSEDYREVLITEGEIDALSFAEAGYPYALSVPRGGGKGEKQNWVEYEYDRLEQCERIYLALDTDETGQEATQELISRLGRERCFIVTFNGFKDGNEALLGGSDLIGCIHAAKTQDPAALKDYDCFDEDVWALYDQVEASGGNPGRLSPWHKLDDKFAFRPGESTVWAGISGHGKSQILGQVCMQSMAAGERWCVASMEFRSDMLLARMFRQLTGMNRPDPAMRPQIRELCEDNLLIYDVQGITKFEPLLEAFKYAMKRYGVTNFIIDSLAKCGLAEDDYNGQKAIVDAISSFARDNAVHVHLVCHTRKTQSSEETLPGKFDVAGTAGIVNMVDNLFLVWRNKPKEAAAEKGENVAGKPDCILSCQKQRNGTGWEGKVGLYFDKASLQYLDNEEDHAINYLYSHGENIQYQPMEGYDDSYERQGNWQRS